MDNRIEIGQEELKRLMIIEDVNKGFMTQKAASELLGISTRQIRRLQNRVKTEGHSGIKSRRIGGNRRISLEQKAKILSIDLLRKLQIS